MNKGINKTIMALAVIMALCGTAMAAPKGNPSRGTKDASSMRAIKPEKVTAGKKAEAPAKHSAGTRAVASAKPRAEKKKPAPKASAKHVKKEIARKTHVVEKMHVAVHEKHHDDHPKHAPRHEVVHHHTTPPPAPEMHCHKHHKHHKHGYDCDWDCDCDCEWDWDCDCDWCRYHRRTLHAEDWCQIGASVIGGLVSGLVNAGA